MNTNSLTPQKAAERAKVSRATIVRALQDRELHGVRSNSGRWSIAPEDLDRWAKRRRRTVQARRLVSDQEQENNQVSSRLTELLLEQLNSVRQEIAERDRRLARLEADAAAQAGRLAETTAEQSARLARLEAEIGAQAAQLAKASADRDAWRKQAERLADRSEPRPEPTPQTRGFRLFRLFRR